MSLGTRMRMAGCKVCADAGFSFEDATRCAYCSAALSSRHEHDHMPVPKRHAGEEIVPVCLNCHDLKDRIDASNWDAKAFFEALDGATPLGRILIAKCLAYMHDALADIDAQEGRMEVVW